MQTQSEVENNIWNYIQSIDEEFVKNADENSDLISAGFFDSLAAINFQAYLEKQFDIKLPNSEINLDNLANVKSIAQLVETYIAKTK